METDDDLSRTRRYLAEVIDECVFVERQRELAEDKLGARITSLESTNKSLVDCVRSLCGYIHVLETDVLMPHADSRGVYVGVEASSIASSRTAMRASIGAVNSKRGASCAALPLPPERIIDFTRNDIALSFQRFASAREKLERHISDAEAAAKLATEHAGVASPCRSPFTPGRKTAKSEEEGDPSHSAARATAYEMTLAALNGEVAALQDNCRRLSRSTSQEISQLRDEKEKMCFQHQERMRECDAVLSRLSLELEKLMVENAQLKKRLRRDRHSST